MSEKKENDVLEHELIPKHSALDEKDAKEVLEKYRIKPYQLPHILSSDPAIKALDIKAGSIIKVVRKSPTAGEAIVYRYVVRG